MQYVDTLNETPSSWKRWVLQNSCKLRMSRLPSQWQFFADLRKNGCKDLRFSAGTLSSKHPNSLKDLQANNFFNLSLLLSFSFCSPCSCVSTKALSSMLLLAVRFPARPTKPHWAASILWPENRVGFARYTDGLKECSTYPPIHRSKLRPESSKFRAKPYDRNEDSGHFSLGEALFSEEKIKNPLDRVLQFNVWPRTWGPIERWWSSRLCQGQTMRSSRKWRPHRCKAAANVFNEWYKWKGICAKLGNWRTGWKKHRHQRLNTS